MNNDIEAKEILEIFNIIWKESGSPHPSSKEYLKLNRIFFYELGIQEGKIR